MKISQRQLNEMIKHSILKTLSENRMGEEVQQNIQPLTSVQDSPKDIESELKRIENDFNRTNIKNGKDKSKTRRTVIIKKFKQGGIPQDVKNVVHFDEDGSKMSIDRNASIETLSDVIRIYDAAIGKHNEHVSKNLKNAAEARKVNADDIRRDRKLAREKRNEETRPTTKQVVFKDGMYLFDEEGKPVMNENCPNMHVFKIQTNTGGVNLEETQAEMKNLEKILRSYIVDGDGSGEYEENVFGLTNFVNHFKDDEGNKIYTIDQELGYPIYRDNNTKEVIKPSNEEDIRNWYKTYGAQTFDTKKNNGRKPTELNEARPPKPKPIYANGTNRPDNSYTDLKNHNDISEFFNVYTEINEELSIKTGIKDYISAIYVVTDEVDINPTIYLRQLATTIRYQNSLPETGRNQGNKGFRWFIRNLDNSKIFVRELKGTPLQVLPGEFLGYFREDWEGHYGEIARQYNENKEIISKRDERSKRVNSGDLNAFDTYYSASGRNYSGTVDESVLAKMILESIKRYLK